MEIVDSINIEENSQNSWNFEDLHDKNTDINEENNERNQNSDQIMANRPKIVISSRNQTLLQKKKKSSNQIIFYELDEPKDYIDFSSSHDQDQNYVVLSGRSSLKNANDVMRVQRPFSSQTNKKKKLTLFQPTPKPPILTGPVNYYRDLDKIDKQLQREFDQAMKRKEIKRQMRSPYKKNFVRLRADSVRSTRNQLQINEKISRRQRRYESQAYLEACKEEFESERRHCKNDYVSKTYPELRIFGV